MIDWVLDEEEKEVKDGIQDSGQWTGKIDNIIHWHREQKRGSDLVGQCEFRFDHVDHVEFEVFVGL